MCYSQKKKSSRKIGLCIYMFFTVQILQSKCLHRFHGSPLLKFKTAYPPEVLQYYEE